VTVHETFGAAAPGQALRPPLTGFGSYFETEAAPGALPIGRNSPQRCAYSQGRYSDRPRREMFAATCSRCGRKAMVPFVPRNDRPVYCSDCFQSNKPARSSSRSQFWSIISATRTVPSRYRVRS